MATQPVVTEDVEAQDGANVDKKSIPSNEFAFLATEKCCRCVRIREGLMFLCIVTILDGVLEMILGLVFHDNWIMISYGLSDIH